jgi:DMSO/TMAO reductase YedYZ molybdopterin-dependent catalytic subunit
MSWREACRVCVRVVEPLGGEPPRLVAPGRVCWSSVKWVERLEVLAEETATTGEALARARLQR